MPCCRWISASSSAEKAPNDFHSRFNVLGKTYRYDFCTSAEQLPCARLHQAHFPGPFDPQHLQAALHHLLGTRQFSSFERTGSRDKSAVDGRGRGAYLTALSCTPNLGRPECWSLRVTGDGFLRQMVRILAGTLTSISAWENGMLPNCQPFSLPATVVKPD